MARGGSVGIGVVEDFLLLLCFGLSAEFIEGGVVVTVVGGAAAGLCRGLDGLVHDSFVLCWRLIEEVDVGDDLLKEKEKWVGISVAGQDGEVLPLGTKDCYGELPLIIEGTSENCKIFEVFFIVCGMALAKQAVGEVTRLPDEVHVSEDLGCSLFPVAVGIPESRKGEAEVLNDDGVTVVVEGEVEFPSVLFFGSLNIEHASETVGGFKGFTTDPEKEVLFVVGECDRAGVGVDFQESHGVDCDVGTFVQELVVSHLGRFFCSCKPCVAIYEGRGRAV